MTTDPEIGTPADQFPGVVQPTLTLPVHVVLPAVIYVKVTLVGE